MPDGRRVVIEHGSRAGYFFGTKSGVITRAGLMVGLAAGTASMVAVLGGILVIAVSDALGNHLGREAEPPTASHHAETAMLATFGAKFVVSVSFAVPLLLLPLGTGVIAALNWGLSILAALSYHFAKIQRTAPIPVVLEHVAIACVVVVLSYGVGIWVKSAFT